jgi:hypothetical protein
MPYSNDYHYNLSCKYVLEDNIKNILKQKKRSGNALFQLGILIRGRYV